MTASKAFQEFSDDFDRSEAAAEARNAEPPKWRTKDGRVLLLSEMKDDHLANTIKWLEVRGALAYAAVHAKKKTHDPVDAAELKMTGFRPDQYKSYKNLLKEQKRRENAAAKALHDGKP